MRRSALIVGVTGGLASEVAKALLILGWSVRGLTREPARAKPRFPELAAIDWRAGDAMVTADIRRAAEGAALILHGANPPRYRNWRALAIPMLENSIDAAKTVGARIVLPGNLYNFGPNAPQPLREDTPQQPSTRKGRIRVEMEEMLERRTLAGRSRRRLFWSARASIRVVQCGCSARAHAALDRLSRKRRGRTLVGVPSGRGRNNRPSRQFPWWAVTLSAPLDAAVALTLQHLGCLPKQV